MSTSAQNYTSTIKSMEKSINPPQSASLQKSSAYEGGDYVLVSRASLLGSNDATPVPSGSTCATSDTKHNFKEQEPKPPAPVGFKMLTSPSPSASVKSLLAKGVTKAGSSFGKKFPNMRTRLVNVFGILNTSAQNSATAISIDPSNSTEFGSLASLYEQMRCHGVTLTYHPGSYKTVNAGTNAASTLSACSVDTAKTGALSALADALDSRTHATYHVGLQSVTAVTPPGVCYRPAKGCVMRFKPLPSDADITLGNNIVGSNWVGTSGSPGNICITGFWKNLEVNDFANSTEIGVLIMEYDVEFRNRD